MASVSFSPGAFVGGLDQLEHSLDAAALQTILTASRAVPIVLLTMPRWKFGLAAPLQDLLTVLGMPTAFNHALADLRGMTGDERRYIKAMRHQAFISVDERGTEAAAATALVAEGHSAGPPPPVLNVNRPFPFRHPRCRDGYSAVHRPGERPDRELRMQPMRTSALPTSMLTRRDMLRSMGLVGAMAAAPPLLSGCGKSAARPPGPVYVPKGGIALANVSRNRGGASARPGAVSAVQALTADLYKNLAAQPGNVVCSPYSVAVALAMTRNGAKGQTAAEMDDVLHASGLQELDDGLNSLTRLVESRAGTVKRFDGRQATISLDVANSLWGQRGTAWQHAFLVNLARYFGTGMRQVDFITGREDARTLINAWTSDQTHGRIPEIIPPDVLDALTRLVLVNAIYLKAPWEETFPSRSTERQPFTRLDGSQVDVDMMSGRMHLVAYGTGPGWRAARLPYVGGDLCDDPRGSRRQRA